jgi:hypothetical protein
MKRIGIILFFFTSMLSPCIVHAETPEFELITPAGHTKSVTSVAFSPDGRHALSGSWDSTMRIWDIETGKEIAALINVGNDDWFIMTPDGYWDSSPGAGSLIGMVRGMDSWNIDQFAVRNNRPDIVLRRMGSNNKSLINHYYCQYKKRLKRLGFTEDRLSGELHVPITKITEKNQQGKNIGLTFSLKDTKYGLKAYNIYVNDVPLFGAYGKAITGKSKIKRETIELASGENKIEISCMNEKGAESYRELTFADYDKQAKGDLYFIGFGASEYQNKDLNLKYAHKDVIDLADTFRMMQGQYETVHIKTYINSEVTPGNIKKAKTFLENATVDDTFVLFISGHGLHDTDEYATYYYLTHNTDPDNMRQTAADFDLIQDLMQGIAPRKKLFLMDTCESGEVEDDTQEKYDTMAHAEGIRARTSRKGLIPNRGEKRAYLYDKDRYIYSDLLRQSGAIAFSTCKGGEFSYESDALRERPMWTPTAL